MMLLQVACLIVLLLCSSSVRAMSPNVERIRKAGVLHCGIDESEAEFSMTDEHGSRGAFDRDLCTAVAVAILGPRARVDTKVYPDEDNALAALRHGDVELVASVSDSLSHSSVDVGFSRPVLYDGASFLILKSATITHASELSGKKICFLAETEVEVTLRRWFKQHHLDFLPFPFQEEGEMEAAFLTGNCTALVADLTRLGNSRAAFGEHAKDYKFLPEVISADTLAAAYRTGDPGFANIVNWTLEVLLQAEESGVNAKSIHSRQNVEDPVVRQLAGKTHEMGRSLGLDDDWAANVIEAVGNYGEIFERNIGTGSPLQLPRGQNALWTQGGMMQALSLN
jgi:general L-amino acid transport system substrate-binding protein